MGKFWFRDIWREFVSSRSATNRGADGIFPFDGAGGAMSGVSSFLVDPAGQLVEIAIDDGLDAFAVVELSVFAVGE